MDAFFFILILQWYIQLRAETHMAEQTFFH